MNWNVWQCLYKNKQILRHLYFCSSLAVLGTSPVYRQNTRWTLVGIFVSTIRLFEAPIKCPPVETIPQKVGPWLFGNATMSPRIGMDTGWKLRHAWMTSDCLFPHSAEAAGEYPQNLRWMEQYSTWLSICAKAGHITCGFFYIHLYSMFRPFANKNINCNTCMLSKLLYILSPETINNMMISDKDNNIASNSMVNINMGGLG